MASESDPVVAEIPVFVLPVPDGVSINRLQFAQRPPTDFEDCTAQYKQSVKQLELEFRRDLDAAIPGTSGSASKETYHGDGFAQMNVLNHALGFVKDGTLTAKNTFRELHVNIGKLFLMPVHQTYDMKRKMVNKAKEAEARQRFDEEKMEVDGQASIAAPAPIRVKFARQETDWQKKRREQSALHKQRLADQDPWIPLVVEKMDPREEYQQAILESNEAPVATIGDDSITVDNLV
ncbi:Protein W06E11.1 [Aphelenchoides avenae]|nr:Protein W06E11.1 [Aphelenchus avenae]